MKIENMEELVETSYVTKLSNNQLVSTFNALNEQLANMVEAKEMLFKALDEVQLEMRRRSLEN